MVRRYRCLVAVACLTALVVTLALPWIGLSICGVGTDVASVDAPAVTPERVGDRSRLPSFGVASRTAAPRAPPLA